MSSVQETEKASIESGRNPKTRVSLADLEARIMQRIDMTGYHAASASSKPIVQEALGPLSVFMLCILVMDNGFCVVGRSAPLDPTQFFPDAQAQFAYEDCIRQLWPLMAFGRLEVWRDRGE